MKIPKGYKKVKLDWCHYEDEVNNFYDRWDKLLDFEGLTVGGLFKRFRKMEEYLLKNAPPGLNVEQLVFSGYFSDLSVDGIRPETEEEKEKRLIKEEKARKKRLADKKKKLEKMRKDMIELEKELSDK